MARFPRNWSGRRSGSDKAYSRAVMRATGNPIAPILATLALTGTLTVGTAASGVIIVGTAPGSTVALSGAGAAGLTVSGSGATRTINGTPTTAGSITVTETLAGATGSPLVSALGTVGAGASAAFRQATTGTSDPDGTNALGSGITKRRWFDPMPLMIGAGQTGRLKLTFPGYFINKSDWTENQISWSGVTAMAAQVHCVNAAGTVVGNLVRLTKGGSDSFVPAAGDVVFDPVTLASLGLTEWPDGGRIMGMVEVDAAAGTLLPMTYVSGSSGDSGAGSYDGGATSLGSTTFSANGGSNGGTRLCQFLKCEIEHTKGAIYGQGTSRVDGKGNQPAGYGLIRGGFMQQAAYKAKRPMAKFATDGDRLEYWARNIRNGQTWRLNHVVGFTDVFIDEPYNDVNVRAVADIFTDLDYLIAQMKAVNPSIRIHLGKSTIRTASASGNWLAPPDQTPATNYLSTGSGTGNAYNQGLSGRANVTGVYDLRPDMYYDAANPDVYYSDGTAKFMVVDEAHFSANGEARLGRADGILTAYILANVSP